MNARRSKRISPGGYPELVDEIELTLIHLTFTPWRLCGKINLDPDYSLAQSSVAFLLHQVAIRLLLVPIELLVGADRR